MVTSKNTQRKLRHNRIRARVAGTAERPRLCVYKSNTQLIAQLIDDENGKTIASISSAGMKGANNTERVEAAAAELAKRAGEKGVQTVVFDRGGFRYIGVIKAFADAARKAGLTF